MSKYDGQLSVDEIAKQLVTPNPHSQPEGASGRTEAIERCIELAALGVPGIGSEHQSRLDAIVSESGAQLSALLATVERQQVEIDQLTAALEVARQHHNAVSNGAHLVCTCGGQWPCPKLIAINLASQSLPARGMNDG